jgi:hypothetical protein
MVKNIIFIILIVITIQAEDTKYFKSIIQYPETIAFEGEMDKEFNIIVDSSLYRVIKDKKSSFQHYYKVYYKNSKPSYAKLIEIKGDSYHIYGKVYRDKNVTETDTNIIIKFNKKGKEIYSNSSNGECNTSYGQNYKEVKCISKDNLTKISTSTLKCYFENGVLKKTIMYNNGEFSNYAVYSTYGDMKSVDYENILYYDRNGKYIDMELSLLEKSYKETFLLNDKRKILESIISRKIEISNIPDLNLTLEEQYFEKIDKLNGR